MAPFWVWLVHRGFTAIREFRVSASSLPLALRGTLVALIAALSMTAHSGWIVGGGFGFLYGVLCGATICLSKGSAALQHAQYIIPASAVTGALRGALIACLAF